MATDLVAEALRVADVMDELRAARTNHEGSVGTQDAARLLRSLAAYVGRLEQHIKDKDHLLVCYRTGRQPSGKVLDRMREYALSARGGGA